MKITILNGNPQPAPFEQYLARLTSQLQASGHSVDLVNLREVSLRYCVGCFGCWVKTPGECSSRDASAEMDRAVIQSDFTLWAAPLKMGFPAELLKMAMDKHIPLIHPHIEVDQGEAHHKALYPKSPRLGLLVENESSTDQEDLQIITKVCCRTGLNLTTRLEF